MESVENSAKPEMNVNEEDVHSEVSELTLQSTLIENTTKGSVENSPKPEMNVNKEDVHSQASEFSLQSTLIKSPSENNKVSLEPSEADLEDVGQHNLQCPVEPSETEAIQTTEAEGTEDNENDNLSKDEIVQKIHSRSAIMESFSPILKSNDTSLDISSNSNKGGDLALDETAVCATGITASSCVGPRPSDFSPPPLSLSDFRPPYFSRLVSPIDGSPDLSYNDVCYAVSERPAYSPTKNPLNQTFKYLPESDENDLLGDEAFPATLVDGLSQPETDDVCLIGEVEDNQLTAPSNFAAYIDGYKSPDSIYYECVPGSFLDPETQTTNSQDILDYDATEACQEIFDSDVNTPLTEDDQLQHAVENSDTDSGTEMDKSPDFAMAGTESNGVELVPADYEAMASEIQTQFNCLVSKSDFRPLAASKTSQSEVETRFAASSVRYKEDSKKIKYVPRITARYDEEQNSANNELPDKDVGTNGSESTEVAERHGNLLQELNARSPIKDNKAPQGQKFSVRPATIRDGKPLITRKPSQGAIQPKPIVKPLAKATIITKKPFVAGGKVTKDVRQPIKPVITKKDTATSISSRSVVAKKPRQTASIASAAKLNPLPGRTTSAASAAAASSRSSSAVATAKKTGPTISAKQPGSKIATASASGKAVGAAPPKTAPQTARIPARQAESVKAVLAVSEHVSSRASPTTQRKLISTSQGVKSKVAGAAASKPTATVTARTIPAKLAPVGKPKAKPNPGK